MKTEYCDCDCHTDKTIRHIMACCFGECPGCNKAIKDEAVGQHSKHCAPLIKLLKQFKSNPKGRHKLLNLGREK